MAVGVMRMVRARAGGVLYTRDPLDPGRDVMVISGVWGSARPSSTGQPMRTPSPSRGRRGRSSIGASRTRRRARWSMRQAASAPSRLRRASAACPASPVRRPPGWPATARRSKRTSAARRTSSGRSTGRGPLGTAVAAAPAHGRPRLPGAAEARPGRRILIDRGIRRLQGRRSRTGQHCAHRRGAAAFPDRRVLVARTMATGLATALPARRRSSPTSARPQGTCLAGAGVPRPCAARHRHRHHRAHQRHGGHRRRLHGNVYEGASRSCSGTRRPAARCSRARRCCWRSGARSSRSRRCTSPTRGARISARSLPHVPRHHQVLHEKAMTRCSIWPRGAARAAPRRQRCAPGSRSRSTCSTWAAGSASTRGRSRPRPCSRCRLRHFSRGCAG